MDDEFAYFLGDNLHFIYKHSIHYDFVQNQELLLHEFIDRSLLDL